MAIPWIILLAATAAPPNRVRLQYTHAGTSCPHETALRTAVAARIGHDPFDPDAAREVRVEVRREGRGLRAWISQQRPATPARTRELTSPTEDCTELFRALELTVALAVDPLSGMVRGPAPTTALPSGPRAAQEPAKQPARTHLALGVGGLASLGPGPAPNWGAFLEGALRSERWEVGLSARGELPTWVQAPEGRVGIGVLQANATGCLVGGQLGLCAAAGGGVLRIQGEGLTRPRQANALFAHLGARGFLEHRLAGPLVTRAWVQLDGILIGTAVTIDERVVWTSPPIAGAGGLQLILRTE